MVIHIIKRYRGNIAVRRLLLAVLCATSLVHSRAQIAGPPSDGGRKALIVGNQNYNQSPLRNALNDANAIAVRLRSVGFEVTAIDDAKAAQLSEAVDAFARSVSENDVALFYYSGHGFQLEGENYLVPLDFTAQTESDAKYGAYPVSRILQKISEKRTRLNILILDSCRDNPFLPTRSTRGGWAAMNTTVGTLIAFATSPGSTASDNPAEANGLFTKYLLQELQTPHIGLQELFDHVRRDVYLNSNKTQLPWTASSLIDDFQFDSSVHEHPVPASPAASRSAPSDSSIVSSGAESQAIDVTALVAKARAEVHLNELESALSDSTKAIRLRAHYSDAYLVRGRAKLLLKEYDQAVSDFSRSITINPTDVAALYYRSIASTAMGQYDVAIRDATEVIRQAPAVSAAYVARASAYLAEGRLAEAQQDCSTAINIEPELSVAYAVRGRARQGLGKTDEARSDFAHAASLQRLAIFQHDGGDVGSSPRK